MPADGNALQSQLLTFEMGGEEYGVDLLQVTEIIEYGTLTQVPTMPAVVRGVVNLRGHVLPVVDLAARFGIPASPVTRRSCVVVVVADVGGERTQVGLVADAVHEVVGVDEGDLLPPPAFGSAVGASFLTGMVQKREKFVMVLDLPRVLALEALQEEILEVAGAA
ncbi:MAG TPA: chemotaxis protein CheW [Gemmatimonadaceae bacterium]